MTREPKRGERFIDLNEEEISAITNILEGAVIAAREDLLDEWAAKIECLIRKLEGRYDG